MRPSRNVCGAVGLLLTTALGACDREAPDPPAPAVAEVRVLPSKITLAAGDGTQLAAEADDGEGIPIGGASLAFRSSDPSKLAVSPTGLIQSEGPLGEGVVVVSSGAKHTDVLVHVTAGSAQTIEAVNGEGQLGTVGGPLSGPVVARVLDAKRNPVSRADVVFTPGDGGVADPPEELTDPRGEASSRWRLGPGAGTQVLSAAVKGAALPNVTFSARAESGPPAKLVGRGDSPVALPRSATEKLEISVKDTQGNPNNGATVRWQVEKGGGHLSSDTSTTDASGIARVVLTTGKSARLNRVAGRVDDLVCRVDVVTK